MQPRLIDKFANAADAAAKDAFEPIAITTKTHTGINSNFYVLAHAGDASETNQPMMMFGGCGIDENAGTMSKAIVTFSGQDFSRTNFEGLADDLENVPNVSVIRNNELFQLLIDKPDENTITHIVNAWHDNCPTAGSNMG